MKKIAYGIFIFVISLFFIPNVFAVPTSLDTSLKVYDKADLLTYEEEMQLREEVQKFIEKYDMDLILLTTNNSLSYSNTRAYAENFYLSNGFGLGNTEDGLIFVIDKSYGYNDLAIATRGHAILVYDDSRIDFILDAVVLQKENGYYSMFTAFLDKADYYADKGVAPSNKDYYIDSNGYYKHKRTFPWVWIILISLAVPSIIVGILVSKNKMIKKATTASAYLDQGSIQYTRREDRFITTHTSSVHIPRNTGGGGSSSRGGSSVHSSGGGSFGGGSRRC